MISANDAKQMSEKCYYNVSKDDLFELQIVDTEIRIAAANGEHKIIYKLDNPGTWMLDSSQKSDTFEEATALANKLRSYGYRVALDYYNRVLHINW
jgi:hypothetical protein